MKCLKCGYTRPSDTKVIGENCPLCMKAYNIKMDKIKSPLITFLGLVILAVVVYFFIPLIDKNNPPPSEQIKHFDQLANLKLSYNESAEHYAKRKVSEDKIYKWKSKTENLSIRKWVGEVNSIGAYSISITYKHNSSVNAAFTIHLHKSSNEKELFESFLSSVNIGDSIKFTGKLTSEKSFTINGLLDEPEYWLWFESATVI
jgi:hypothetical protein